MRLKYLSLSLLSLSLAACSSHVIKTNPAHSSLDQAQRASKALNAVYEYPSFDYSGQVKVNLAQDQGEKTSTLANPEVRLEPEIERKLNQYLAAQNIKLNTAEKQALYKNVAKKDVASLADVLGKGANFVETMLNDLNIQYDGTVNYRQKMASMNISTEYKKPNLLVAVRVPMVVDFNDYKFYTQIFSLVPYLANPQDQDKYAYFDFSKYKDHFSKVNKQALIEYLKQSSATSYALASQDQLQSLRLTDAERQQGIVEKIRLNSSVEELFLQASLYNTVNREYLMQSVFGVDAAAAEQSAIEALAAQAVAEAAAEPAEDSEDERDEATAAMYKLYEAVNKTVLEISDEEDEIAVAETATAAEDATDAAIAAATDATAGSEEDETASEDEEAESTAGALLTEQQCEDLSKNKSSLRMGDVTYCQDSYDIDVFETVSTPSLLELQLSEKSKALTEKFASLGSKDELVTAQRFKQLWSDHQADIDAILVPKAKRNPFIMDISLDQQGRMVKADYDLKYDLDEFDRKLNVKFDMQFKNYGNASKIDRRILNQAKSFKDIFKGSPMQQVFGAADPTSASPAVDFSEYLNQLAEKLYQQTQSYEKTYKAVFIAKLTHDYPQIVKQYSAQDLQEIAAVYAYAYSDEDIYNLKGQALKQVQALQKKHHLQENEQFDHDMGNDVDEIVVEAMSAQKSMLEMQKLLKQYKTTEAVFAHHYAEKFKEDNELEAAQQAEFKKTVNILGKAYVALKNNKFKDSTIASLTEDSVEFIDYAIFKETYEALSDANLK
ncbi:hypothetical protein DJ533_04745 [Acinetobacter defluvii]|uniref:Lipoprotein n=1 Tax=Acinetobacter defluvii TaxID=1871111 RepID=A0A2S2FCA5_9GAMM|nr:hypothetical protein [Acinetobacter defluvii]AWL27942.1 hypothetical protein DJ533_04745 [Acinetobacter defluvii]